MSIERNVLIRSTVQAVVDLISEDGITEDELLKALQQRQPKQEEPLPPEAFNDDQAKEFERLMRMPYGMHKGKKIIDVDINTLCWYADSRFNDNLRRYLKSARGRERIEKEVG